MVVNSYRYPVTKKLLRLQSHDITAESYRLIRYQTDYHVFKGLKSNILKNYPIFSLFNKAQYGKTLLKIHIIMNLKENVTQVT